MEILQFDPAIFYTFYIFKQHKTHFFIIITVLSFAPQITNLNNVLFLLKQTETHIHTVECAITIILKLEKLYCIQNRIIFDYNYLRTKLMSSCASWIGKTVLYKWCIKSHVGHLRSTTSRYQVKAEIIFSKFI